MTYMYMMIVGCRCKFSIPNVTDRGNLHCFILSLP